MFKLGQNTSNRLLKGIFVSLLAAAVARMRSTTVRARSRFSCGSREINVLRSCTSWLEAAGMPWNEGMASVESEGGFRRPALKFPFGLLGNPGVGRVVILVVEGW